jgi:hypothetical protein
MYSRLIAFVVRNGVLTDAQNGFRKKDKLKQQYSPFLKVYRRLSRKVKPNWNFFYLTKACAVLNHEILLAKLNSYGVRGRANVWFESYIYHIGGSMLK